MYIERKKVASTVRADTEVAPDATELLFDAEDVAQLIAEVTGEDVVVDVADETGDSVTFEIAGEEFTVQTEGTEEVLEASTRFVRGKKPVAASTKNRGRAPASRTSAPAAPSASRTVKKVVRPGK